MTRARGPTTALADTAMERLRHAFTSAVPRSAREALKWLPRKEPV